MALEKNFLKPSLSIQNIGIGRFIRGIIVGLSLSILLYLFTLVVRDALKLIVPIQNMPVQNNTSHYLTNLFFAALAIVFSFNITMIIWFSKSKYMNIKYRVRKNLFKTNSFFGAYSTLSWFSRIALLYGVLLPTYFLGFENLFSEYAFALILILLYLFFQQWNYVAFIYKTGKWMLNSFIVLITLSYIYSNFSVISNDKLNRTHELRTKYRFEFIEKELKRGEKWGIHFSEIEASGLKYSNSYVSKKYKNQIIEALVDTSDTIDLKLLILHKIFIHNFYYRPRFSIPIFSYNSEILSIDKYEWEINQIRNIINNKRLKILFEILNELNLLFFPKIDFNQDEFLTMSYGEISRLERIFLSSNVWPKKWEEFKALREFGDNGFYSFNQELVEVEDVYMLENSETKIKVELRNLIKKILIDPKYSAYHDIIENRTPMSELSSDQ